MSDTVSAWRLFGSRPEAPWRRLISIVLVLLVTAGGLCPALYLGMLPHQHLFVGGSPPADWENHDHPNPLFALFGSPAGSRAPIRSSGESVSGNGPANQPVSLANALSNSLRPVRVVSLYPGLPGLVLSVVTLSAVVPTRLSRPAIAWTWPVPAFSPSPRGRRPVEPPTPPPRSAG